MIRFRNARRWATAGLLAFVALAAGERSYGQDGLALPPIGSAPTPPRVLPGSSAARTPAPGVILTPKPAAPKSAAPPTTYLPGPADDGLGQLILTPGPAPAPAPAAPAPAKADAPTPAPAKADAPAPGDRFAKVPPVQPLPRAGWFPIPPTGPGFYTLHDELEDEERQAPPKYPYSRISIIPNSFFDVDWRYLDDPKNTETDFWDCLKRQRCGPDDCFMFTSGGELRARYNWEANSRLLNTGPARLRGADNTYDLYRARVYGDLYMTEKFRLYGEVISALSPDYLLQPLPIDRNQADLLNLFVDAQLLELCDQPLWFRVGRQELLYGSQRLISTLDWANTRRTFQGGKLFWQDPKNSVDLFLVQPVIPNDDELDSVDNNQVFAGLWYTHRPRAGNAIDAYYLMLDNTNNFATGRGGVMGPQTTHTVGARWVGDSNNWLWDFEGMIQFGEAANQGLFATACTLGGGYHFKDCCGTPMFFLYYDYASGTPNPGESNLNQTFNQLFPFGHYYFGFVDVVGRRNINDIAAVATVWPAKWLFMQFQCHNFLLDSPRDALYNAGGNAIRRDPTGQAGSFVGTELDLMVNFHLSNHSDVLFSYSYLFAGDFIKNTATTPAGRQDPQALYVQYSYRW